MRARSAKNHEGTVSEGATNARDRHSTQMIECVSCSETKPHHGRGLCTACYQRVYKRPKTVCSECGRMMRMATKELCPACYYGKKPRSTKIIECASCGEIKQHAAHGLCRGCYNRNRQSYMERQQKLANKRCETCDRLLRIVRSRVDMRTKFCDGFCRGHSPERNAKLNIKRVTRDDGSRVAAPQGRGVVTHRKSSRIASIRFFA